MEKLIQITAGRGPAECCWVVAQLQKLLLKEAKAKALRVEVVAQEKGEMNRTLNSTLIRAQGEPPQLAQFVANWRGSVLWIGQSPFRKFHKRKNWFVGVNVLDHESTEERLQEREIRYEVFRSSGPGGQHSNKVSSAVRAVHIPTGVSANASESRSQQQNKKKAKERLFQLVQQRIVDAQKEEHSANWRQHDQLVRGNPIRTFKGKLLVEVH